MRSIKNIVLECLTSNNIVQGRNGTVRSIYGPSLTHNFYGRLENFPLLTLRKLHFRTIARELCWILSGSTNVKDLHPCRVWDKWADEDGNLGPTYGEQMRKSPDQLKQAEMQIALGNQSRRIMIDLWNAEDKHEMRLPPCVFAYQFHVMPNRRLGLTVYQRSCDVIIGLPHDLASSALFLCMMCHVHGYKPSHLTMHFGDAHLYQIHEDAANTLIDRSNLPLSTLDIVGTNYDSILEIPQHALGILKYNHHKAIDVEVVA